MTIRTILPAILIWLCLISAISVFVTVLDKKHAQKHQRRVPERTLLWLSALGGSAAMYLTMRRIHHKTKHPKFMVGIPVIFFAEAAGIAALFFFGILVW